MRYCSNCGAQVVLRVPPADDRPRYVCETCKTVHYENPKVVAGCIPETSGRILLCRRAIEPRRGLWTFPAGFMELGETTAEAALRETAEEANAAVEIESLFALFNIPHISQVYLVFRGRLLNEDYSPGHESLDVRLFTEQDIPWREIAFPVIAQTLDLYYEDRRRGAFQVHNGDIRQRLVRGG